MYIKTMPDLQTLMPHVDVAASCHMQKLHVKYKAMMIVTDSLSSLWLKRAQVPAAFNCNM